jgi:molybdopterin-guanine dinucleotide biosynthesis protein A
MTVPRIGETTETLCAVYSKSCLAPIEALLMAGRKSVQELMERVRVRILPELEFQDLGGGAAFFNINTREDYEEAKRRMAHPHPQGVQHG